MAFVGLNLFFLLGATVIILCALLLRLHRLGRRVSFRFTLVIVHTAILCFCIALYPTGIFICDGLFSDVYGAYLFVPGLYCYWIGGAVAGLLWPWLQTVMTYYNASIACIVFIPGVVGLVLGAVQWYLIGALLDEFGRTTRWIELVERASGRLTSYLT